MGRKSREKREDRDCTQHRDQPCDFIAENMAQEPLRAAWKNLLLIAIVSIAVYSNTLSMDFVSDDLTQIKENTLIRSLKNIPQFFTTEVWYGVKGYNQTPYYRPTFTFSLAIDYFFWGEKPSGYHLTNVLLHMLAASAVYFLSLKILKNKTAAFLSGILFSVHPVHSEAVTWIAARNEAITALFMSASFYAYILFKERQKNGYLPVSVLLFFGALLSKEMAITLPGLIILYEVCFDNKEWSRKIKYLVLFIVPVAFYFVLRFMFLEMAIWQSVPLAYRVYTGSGIVADYLRLLVLPLDLKVHYDMPVKRMLVDAGVLIPMFMISAIVTGIFVLRKHDKRIVFSLLWIFIALIPVSGIPTLIWPSLMAERYLYIPSIGFTMAAGLLLSMLTAKLQDSKIAIKRFLRLRYTAIIKAAIVVLIMLLAAQNYRNNYAWKDQMSLAARTVKDAPNYEAGYNDLGVEYTKIGRLEDAERNLKSALKIRPYYSEGLNNLGIVYRKQKRLDEALNVLLSSKKIDAKNLQTLNSLGLTYIDMGRYEDAIKEFNLAIGIEPRYAELHNNLGVVYIKLGRFDEALKELALALKLEPAYAEAFNNLGLVYLKMGQNEGAKREFQNAVRIRPDYAQALENLDYLSGRETRGAEEADNHYNRATEYMSKNMLNEAVNEFRIALRLKPDDPEVYNNLGAVYAKMGKLQDAEREFENALKLKTKDAGINYNLGTIRMKLGKIDEAVVNLRAAVGLAPDNPLFKKALDRVYEMQKSRS